jgi:surfeit locus 1 family protein
MAADGRVDLAGLRAGRGHPDLAGLWQVQRLEWKEGVLAAIAARIGAARRRCPPPPIPIGSLHARDGRLGFEARELFVLTSRRGQGAGYRVICPVRRRTGGA